MSMPVILSIYAVGAAALGLWLVVRFPSLGPRRLTGVLLMSLAALIGMRVASTMIDPVAQRGSHGVVLALLLVILPALTWVFWSAALMLRMLAAVRP
jgi:hypothetical protein